MDIKVRGLIFASIGNILLLIVYYFVTWTWVTLSRVSAASEFPGDLSCSQKVDYVITCSLSYLLIISLFNIVFFFVILLVSKIKVYRIAFVSLLNLVLYLAFIIISIF
jgi:hypothetical protein